MVELKPYPTYKDSGVVWLGQVPKHWKIRSGRSCYLERYRTNLGLKESTVLSLSFGRIVVKPENKLHGLVPASFETYQIVEPGEVICRPTDLQNDQTSLRFGQSQARGIITSAYICLATQDGMNSDFGFLLLHSYDLKKIFYGLGSGLRQNLDWNDFKGLPCLLPPASEQDAIVRFFNWADQRIRQAIRVRQQRIKLLAEYKQALIHQAVTGQIDVRTGKPYPAYKHSGVEWLEMVPEHWGVVTLRRVIRSAVDGPHHSPDYVDDGIPFLSARNIKIDSWSLGDIKYISETDYKEFCRRVTPELGDILYTKGGTTGVARAVDLKFRFQVWVHVAVLKIVRSKVLPEFLAVSLNAPRGYEQSQLFTRGATNQDLGLGRMKQIVLALPPLAEQTEILANLGSTTHSVASGASRAQDEIALLREYRTRLIADVVTGKLDVRHAAANLPDEVRETATLEELDDSVNEEEMSLDESGTEPEEALA